MGMQWKNFFKKISHTQKAITTEGDPGKHIFRGLFLKKTENMSEQWPIAIFQNFN
jgi:hypothetical protein